jgi:hypothetical protein
MPNLQVYFLLPLSFMPIPRIFPAPSLLHVYPEDIFYFMFYFLHDKFGFLLLIFSPSCWEFLGYLLPFDLPSLCQTTVQVSCPPSSSLYSESEDTAFPATCSFSFMPGNLRIFTAFDFQCCMPSSCQIRRFLSSFFLALWRI